MKNDDLHIVVLLAFAVSKREQIHWKEIGCRMVARLEMKCKSMNKGE